MCMICLQRMMVGAYWEAWLGEPDPESLNFGATIYQQEPQLYPLFGFAEFPMELGPSPEVDFCLLWVELLREGFSADAIERFSVRHGRYVLDFSLDAMADRVVCTSWRQLIGVVRRGNGEAWSACLQSQRDELAATASKLLGEYRQVCLYTEHEEAPSYAFSPSGPMICSQPDLQERAQNWGVDDKMPLLFAALSYLQATGLSDEIIEAIALAWSRCNTSFEGLNFWLKRRAWLYCLSQQGVKFLLDHREIIDYVLIPYAVLMGALDADDLRQAEQVVMDHSDRWIFEEERSRFWSCWRRR